MLHKRLTSERWAELSLLEQMGNIGSEVGRAAARRRQGDENLAQKALERALELIDLTVQDKRWRARLTEILRAREVLCDTFYGSGKFQSSPEGMERYFM